MCSTYCELWLTRWCAALYCWLCLTRWCAALYCWLCLTRWCAALYCELCLTLVYSLARTALPTCRHSSGRHRTALGCGPGWTSLAPGSGGGGGCGAPWSPWPARAQPRAGPTAGCCPSYWKWQSSLILQPQTKFFSRSNSVSVEFDESAKLVNRTHLYGDVA